MVVTAGALSAMRNRELGDIEEMPEVFYLIFRSVMTYQ